MLVDNRINVKLGEHMRPILEKQAKLERRTIKEIVTRAIEMYLENSKKEEK